MAINSVAASSSSLEIASLRLAKGQQEQEGQASLELLESASNAVPPSSDPSRGNTINTFA